MVRSSNFQKLVMFRTGSSHGLSEHCPEFPQQLSYANPRLTKAQSCQATKTVIFGWRVGPPVPDGQRGDKSTTTLAASRRANSPWVIRSIFQPALDELEGSRKRRGVPDNNPNCK